MENLIAIIIGAIFVNNIVLTRILGICPYIGVSKQTSTALQMGYAVTFVMTSASFITWFIQRFILIPLNLEYLQIIAFILVIASFVQLTEIFIKRVSQDEKLADMCLDIMTGKKSVYKMRWKMIRKYFQIVLKEKLKREK